MSNKINLIIGEKLLSSVVGGMKIPVSPIPWVTNFVKTIDRNAQEDKLLTQFALSLIKEGDTKLGYAIYDGTKMIL